ncbi:MAG: hypothetical protein BWY68_00965 [bacterium ADurb.Bin400]|nr:MAG: hypothetical protein BWY68_00965 [bacterium ADurb.Bin400]
MFYLYDERMASCLVGVISQCDNAGYYQRAIDFGGVGQQIAYATAWFDKRYKSFVDTYNQPILIDNNTLICESIATRVLYLYTPHIYPAQKNFYDYYALWWSKPNVNSINDTEALISKTYNPSVTLTGSKDVDTRVYIRSTNTLVADLGTPSWVLTVEAPGGTTVYTLEYQKEDGTILATKTLEIKRHKMADINGDNQVDLLDLSMLADHWNHVHPGEPMVDLNADGTVDLLDLSILASNWSS